MIFADGHNVHDFGEWNLFVVVVATMCVSVGLLIKFLQERDEEV